MSIDPIRQSVMLRSPPTRAFDAFTKDMARWWPKHMSTGGAPFAEIVLEPHPGGRWFERAADGAETNWGNVLAWDEPGRLLLAWRIDANFKFDPDLLTELELTFAPEGGGTRVTLEHRGLERFGPSAAQVAELLRNGWPAPVRSFAEFVDKPSKEGAEHG